MNHDRFALWDGAYVLGALSSADRHDFEDHLADCDRCSAAVAELSGLPGLLATVPLDVALAEPTLLPMPAAGRDEVLFAAIRSRRRRARVWTSIVVAAAAVMMAVAVGVLVQRQDPPGQAAMHPMTHVVPTVIDATTAITPHPWGTTVSLECTYRTAGPDIGDQYGTETEEYALTVTDRSGRITRLATWIGHPGSTVTPTASTSLAADSIRSVDIRATDTDEVLLTAPM